MKPVLMCMQKQFHLPTSKETIPLATSKMNLLIFYQHKMTKGQQFQVFTMCQILLFALDTISSLFTIEIHLQEMNYIA